MALSLFLRWDSPNVMLSGCGWVGWSHVTLSITQAPWRRRKYLLPWYDRKPSGNKIYVDSPTPLLGWYLCFPSQKKGIGLFVLRESEMISVYTLQVQGNTIHVYSRAVSATKYITSHQILTFYATHIHCTTLIIIKTLFINIIGILFFINYVTWMSCLLYDTAQKDKLQTA